MRHGKRRFTPELDSQLEAMIDDEELETEWRLLALIYYQANGNFSDYAVDSETGVPLGPKQFAQRLGKSEPRIVGALNFLEARGYIDGFKRRKGRIQPTDDPKAELERRRNGETSSTLPRSNAWIDFKRAWLANHPTERKELAQAQATIKRIEKMILNDYKNGLNRQRNAEDDSTLQEKMILNDYKNGLNRQRNAEDDSTLQELEASPVPDSGNAPVPDSGNEKFQTPETKTGRNLIRETLLNSQSCSSSSISETTTTSAPPPIETLEGFDKAYTAAYAASHKPLPTKEQSQEAFTMLPPGTRQAYLDDLTDSSRGEPRIARFKHPGAARRDIPNFLARKWPHIRAAQEAAARSRAEFEARQAAHEAQLAAEIERRPPNQREDWEEQFLREFRARANLGEAKRAGGGP